MAPLFHLFLALFLASSALASPHLSRNFSPHTHRAIGARHPIDVLDRSPVIPKRKRSLNKRCIPRPSNTTTSSSMSSSSMSSSSMSSSSMSSSTMSSSTMSSSTPTPPSAYSTPLNVAPPPSPAPSSSSPSPSPTPTPTPTSSAAPAETSPPSSGNSGGPSFLNGQQTGQGTWYETGLGACGITNNDQQHICAVSHLLYDAYPGYNGVNPNDNPVCGRQITLSYNGKSVTVTVTDRCEACKLTDLDLSPSAFGALSDLGAGRIDIKWDWV